MTPDYVISLPDGRKINLLFNTWMYRAYSAKKGIELEQLLENVTKGIAFKAADLPTLLITAAESYCKYSKEHFAYSDIDACEWVDELGMFISSPQVMEIYVLFVAKLVKVSPDSLETAIEKAKAEEAPQEKSPDKPAKKKGKG